MRIHLVAKAGSRTTACKRRAAAVDVTTSKRKVTCKTCKRVVAARERPPPIKSRRPFQVGKKGAPAKRGPKPLLDDRMSASIVSLVEEGNYMEVSAAIHGVSTDTLYRWLRRGVRMERECERVNSQIPRDEAVYTRFASAMKRAQASAQASLLAGVRSSGFADPKHWTALAWILERKWPEKFSKRQVIQVADGESLESPEVDLSKLSTSELEAMEALLAKAVVDEEDEGEE